MPLRVKLTLLGEPTPAYEFALSTDERGAFTLSDVLPNTYDVAVKNSHTLQNTRRITVIAGMDDVDFGTLREGDANDDNFVTMVDFSILATAFGQGAGDAAYDDRADFNEDDFVTLIDFSLLATNFGQAGDTLQENAARVASPPVREPESIADIGVLNQAGDVVLSVVPQTITADTGQTFDMVLQVQAGSQPVNGASAYLQFDRDVLRVDSLTPGTTLPLGLQNEFDNTAGKLDFAAGVFCSGADCPSGTFTLVTVKFTAVDESAGTSLSFSVSPPRQSDVTADGASVLDRTVGGTVIIGGPGVCFDFDADGQVDVDDIRSTAHCWGSADHYDSRYDVFPDVPDGTVNVLDILTVAMHEGEECP